MNEPLDKAESHFVKHQGGNDFVDAKFGSSHRRAKSEKSSSPYSGNQHHQNQNQPRPATPYSGDPTGCYCPCNYLTLGTDIPKSHRTSNGHC
jgi:hypothetical protein